MLKGEFAMNWPLLMVRKFSGLVASPFAFVKALESDVAKANEKLSSFREAREIAYREHPSAFLVALPPNSNSLNISTDSIRLG